MASMGKKKPQHHLCFDVIGAIEVIGRSIGLDQLTAGRRPIPIDDSDAQVLDVVGGGVAPQHQLDDGHGEHHERRARIAQNV
jgi:hypothetical protein